MTNYINNFFNKNYLDLPPIDKKNYRSVVNLSSNESQHEDFFKLFETFIKNYDPKIVTRYPIFRDAHNCAARYHNILNNQLMLVPGSDFGINLILHALGDNATGLITHEPNYIGYEHYATLKNIKTTKITSINPSTLAPFKNHLVVITNPEGFFGTNLQKNEILDIAITCKNQNNILIIDEAYIEFNEFDHISFLTEFSNIIIVRSYSKGLGLASMRIGTIISSEQIINYLTRYASENCIADISLEYLIFLLEKPKIIKKINSDICKIRNDLYDELTISTPHWHVYKSSTNFITIRTRSKTEAILVENSFQKNGVRIRRLTEKEEYANHIRMTIPSKQKCELILKTLNEVYTKNTKESSVMS